jgi:serine/threonine protein kinase/WD40 repeat protein
MTSDRWADVDRLFHAALERPRHERAAFLDEACAGDAVLRREVESLLGHESAASEFLEQPALQQEAARLASVVQGDPQIPGFKILGTLGEGGMGIVYLAQQTVPIHRRVALKLIKHGMDSRRVIARFEAEREALARMQHPHIAAVYDAGTTPDGRPYFVMEYVEGVPVTEYCDRQRLSTRARLELFIDVCGAVQHAHQKGVIHRDLKPSNVLVADTDGRPQAKIIDFGVAKATDRSMLGGTAFTEAGTIVGTPEYMSPEQAALSDDIDTATDVYSLGVLLYELLVGALPFDPAVLRAAGFDEMRRIIRESDPARPSTRLAGADAAASAATRQSDAGRLTRQLRGDLDWITLKALEKDRRLRYSTVAAFAADIGHYLADEPIAARAPSAAYRLRKFARRYRGVVAAASVVLIVLVAGLVASLTQYARAESQRAEANQQRAQADRQRQAALTAVDEASAQRNAAVAANEQANRLQLAATTEAAAAEAARRELERRGYALTIAAADGELQLRLATAARSRLLAVPVQQRGWEWHHLLMRTDSSVATFDRPASCEQPPGFPAMPLTISDNVLTIDAGRDRMSFRRCTTLQVWGRSDAQPVKYALPGRVIAVGPGGVSLVVSPSFAGPATRFALHVVEPVTAHVRQSFAPLTAEPICGAFNYDGTRVAVGLKPAFNPLGEPINDVFDVWDVANGTRLVRLTPPDTTAFDTRFRPAMSCMVAFSPDSSRLATSGGTVRVWRVDSGVEVATGDGQAGTVSQPIAWSGDGSRLAIGRPSGLVDLLDLAGVPRIDHFDGNGLVRELPMPPGDRRFTVTARSAAQVLAMAFSPDGARIVTGADRTVGVWSVEERRLKTQLSGHGGRIVGVAIEPGGRFWTADHVGQIKVWPAVGQGGVSVLPGVPSFSESALSRNGAVLATSESDGGLYAWRLADLHREVLRTGTGVIDRSRPLPPGEPSGADLVSPALTISSDGGYVLSSVPDLVGTVRTWQVGSGLTASQAVSAVVEQRCEGLVPAAGRQAPRRAVFEMELGPDGRSLAFQQGRCLVVRDMPTSTNAWVLPEFTGSSNRGRAFAFRPDGLLIILSVDPTANDPGPARVQIWDWRKQRIVADAPTPSFATASERRLMHLVISPGGGCVATVGGVQTIVSIWDGDLRRELGRIPVPSDTRDVALSADCTRLASIGPDMTVRIWDVGRREQLLVLVDDDQHENNLQFTLDGRLIARRSSGGFTIWESVRRH